jgi:hypothetical protein
LILLIIIFIFVNYLNAFKFLKIEFHQISKIAVVPFVSVVEFFFKKSKFNLFNTSLLIFLLIGVSLTINPEFIKVFSFPFFFFFNFYLIKNYFLSE